jgi:hypothetical protein
VISIFFFYISLLLSSGEEAFLILHVCPHHQAGPERKFMRIYDAELHARPEMAAAPPPHPHPPPPLWTPPKKIPELRCNISYRPDDVTISADDLGFFEKLV